jgi:hypothetical protein
VRDAFGQIAAGRSALPATFGYIPAIAAFDLATRVDPDHTTLVTVEVQENVCGREHPDPRARRRGTRRW